MDALKVARALTRDVNNLLLAKAHAKLMDEKITPVKMRILAENEFVATLTGEEGKVVLDPDRLYFLSEADVRKFCDLMNDEYVAMGFHDLPEDHCPLLTAEHLVTDAENAVILKASRIMNFNHKLVYGKKREELIELAIKLVVNSPGYKKVNVAELAGGAS